MYTSNPITPTGVEYSEKEELRQEELEAEAFGMGIERYWKNVRRAEENKDRTSLQPEHHILKASIPPMAGAIHELCNGASKGDRSFHKVKEALSQVKPEEIAFVTIRHLINSITETEPIQTTAINVAKDVLNHISYAQFKKEHGGLVHHIERGLVTAHRGHRHKVLTAARIRAGVQDVDVDQVQALKLGMRLIQMYISSTGLGTMIRYNSGRHTYTSSKGRQTASRVMHRLAPSEELTKWINEKREAQEGLSPCFQPMVVPPTPWTGFKDGGYRAFEVPFVKCPRDVRKDDWENKFEDEDMTVPMEAINILQATPWKINTRVLEVLEECWKAGTGIAGLPPADKGLTLPPKFWRTDAEWERLQKKEPERISEWKRKTAVAHDSWATNNSKRVTVGLQLEMARKFKDEKAIYFPWNCDWRGRIYPLVPHLNPQADDAGKGLLEFAEGKPLGPDGAYWLAVDLANNFGEDKISLDERVAWTKKHQAQILDCAVNPLDGTRFWMEADNPFKFLSGCFEWAGYVEQGEDYVSHHPVAMDGSCNGLQNFSALLLDEVGGSAVNLTPGNKPSDVYNMVAERVNEILKVRRKSKSALERRYATKWIRHVDRGLVKRNVMTLPYGATKQGFADQLLAEVKKRKLVDHFGKDLQKACVFLADINMEAMGGVIVKAVEAMDWLREIASTSSKSVEEGMCWYTPMKFPVFQVYPKTKSKRIETYFGQTRLQLTLQLPEGKKLNPKKMANGLAPNYIHSLDASHLMSTLLKCRAKGISDFAMIHDSYGTHPSETGKLNDILREAFIEQYRVGDLLHKFMDSLSYQVPDDVYDELPEPPSTGKLNIENVRSSAYFFA